MPRPRRHQRVTTLDIHQQVCGWLLNHQSLLHRSSLQSPRYKRRFYLRLSIGQAFVQEQLRPFEHLHLMARSRQIGNPFPSSPYFFVRRSEHFLSRSLLLFSLHQQEYHHVVLTIRSRLRFSSDLQSPNRVPTIHPSS